MTRREMKQRIRELEDRVIYLEGRLARLEVKPPRHWTEKTYTYDGPPPVIWFKPGENGSGSNIN